jgi:choline transport protein
VIAWQAASASCGYLTATTLQGLIINSQPDYAPQRWQGTLLVFAVMLISLIFNTFLSSYLPMIENTILFFHVTLFFVIMIVLTVMAPVKSESKNVWALFLNEGGYESKGVSFFVGLITPLFAFAGADGAVHMCEEIKNASTVLPWAMMGTSPFHHYLPSSNSSFGF